MILAFKEYFIPKIKNQTKIHTIREDKPNRWKAGNKIHFATGVRTKNYNQFYEGYCISTQTITIFYPPTGNMGDIVVKVDGRELNLPEKQTLSWNDGFLNLLCFIMWFKQDFTGKIIHWTNLRY